MQNDCGSSFRCGTPANLKGCGTMIVIVRCSRNIDFILIVTKTISYYTLDN